MTYTRRGRIVGLVRALGERVSPQGDRGFESLPLRRLFASSWFSAFLFRLLDVSFDSLPFSVCYAKQVMKKRFVHSVHSFFAHDGLIKLTIGAFFVIFGLLSLQISLQYTSAVPWYDSWQLLEMKMENWSLWTLFRAQQNEHRAGLGLLLLNGVLPFMHWDLRVGAYLVWFSLALSCVLALILVRRLRGSFELWDGIIPFIFFSLYQWENLTWGYQITFTIFLPIFLAALFLFTLRPGALRDGVLLVLCFLGTISSAQGLFMSLIIVGFFIFEALTVTTRRMNSLILAAIGFIIASTYFWGFDYFHFQDKHRGFLGARDYAGFVIDLINGSIEYKSKAILSGILPSIMLLSFEASVVLLFRNKNVKDYITFSLLSFSVILISLLAYNRMPLGSGLAYNSRYATLLVPSYFGLYLLLDSTPVKIRNAVVGFMAVLYVFVAAMHYDDVYQLAQEEYDTREEFRRCYVTTRGVQECPGNMSDDDKIQRILEFAQQKNISIYYEQPSNP